MGLRGPGATKLKMARAEASKSKRRLPWKAKGLDRVGRVKAFIEFLPITKGPLAGKRMKLLPGQMEFIRAVYGRQRKGGKRLIRLAIKSEPKGNGKTGLVAGLALCHLLGPESEKRGEVYSAAIDRQQAGIMFNEMEAIIAAVPEFAARVNCQRFLKKMEVLEGDGLGSIYEALSADARRAHGLSPSLWVYDELAQAKDRTLLDNLMQGMGKRAEALGIVISTQAPNDEHPLSQLIDDGLSAGDATMFVQLTCAPPEADPFDEKTWRDCNPALGVYLSVDEMREQAARAQRLPAFEPAFRNLRLNQRVDANVEARIVPPQVWKQCAGMVDREALRGRSCWAALDLSGKHDLTALVLVFPDDSDPPAFDILPFFWTPEGQLESRRPAERDRFKEWIARKFLIPVPGQTIRFGFVANELAKLDAEFDIREVAYDRWRIDDFKAELGEIGCEVPLEPFGQGFKDMGPAVESFAEMALTSRLRHGGHPVLTAAVAGAILVSDPAGNQKFEKDKSHLSSAVRIDGAVALAMALRRALMTMGPATTSFWEVA
jgi:phage terminase large subunit-like protein